MDDTQNLPIEQVNEALPPVTGPVADAPAEEMAPAVAPETPADLSIIDTAVIEPEAPADAAAPPIEQVDELEDVPADPEAINAAPPRLHQSLVDQLEMRWNELKDFVRVLDGSVEGELGEALALARHYLKG